MKLAVGFPWDSPFTYTGFTDATLNLRHPPGCEVRFVRGRGFCPARRHNHICEQAVNWGADLILIIGADQLHPEDMLCRLVERFKEGYEVVSAMVPSRGFVSWQEMEPFQPMAWRFKSGNMEAMRSYSGMEVDGDLIEVVQKDTGMQTVDFIGSGVLMFHVDHLRAMARPWFREIITDDPGYNRRASMDCTFVWRLATESGAQVWCDTDIDVRHLHIFEIDGSYSERFKDWKKGNGDPSICQYRPKEETVAQGV